MLDILRRFTARVKSQFCFVVIEFPINNVDVISENTSFSSLIKRWFSDATGLPQFVTLRMKMIDPVPYLALMVCDEHFAMILAVSGEEPAFEDMAVEAEKLGFRGIGMPVVKDEEATVAKTPDDSLNRVLEATSYRRHKSPFFSDDPYFT